LYLAKFKQNYQSYACDSGVFSPDSTAGNIDIAHSCFIIDKSHSSIHSRQTKITFILFILQVRCW